MSSKRQPKICTFFRVYLPPLVIYGVIFYLSSKPPSALPAQIPDFIPHFIEYALLSFFFIRMFGKKRGFGIFVFSFLWLLALAFLDELHQHFVPGRYFTLEDMLMDSLGIAAGLAAYRFRRSRLKRDADSSHVGKAP